MPMTITCFLDPKTYERLSMN